MTRTVAEPTASRSTGRDLEPLFGPKSVAVVGASRTEGSVGHAIVRNLVFGGYTGVIYPINPKARSILGIRCAPGIAAIDEKVDLAVIVVPAPHVAETVAACADHGTRHFVVISAGFKEIGGEGPERERGLARLARERGLSILGPNCLGVINTHADVKLNATFARGMPTAGRLGLISQSGALCTALLDYARGRRIGFSRFVSFGNKSDVNEIDLLRSLAADAQTHVILMYVEELSHGADFIETCQVITRGGDPKPILAIKTGRTAQGAAAAASHTGSMAGSDEVYDALLAQSGVMRLNSVAELFDAAQVFVDPALPTGRRTAIVTNAGGPGIMATDACIGNDLRLAKFADYTIKALGYQLPPTASIRNPVDVIGDAKHDRYRAALDAVTSDEGVDLVMVIVTPQNMTDVVEIARVIGETHEFCRKPIVACMMGMVDVSPGVELLETNYKVPTFTFPEAAMRALAAKCRFAEWTRTPATDFKRFEVDRAAATGIVDSELQAGRNRLVEAPALRLLSSYGFPVVPFQLAATAEEAVAAAERIGYPVVMKIAAPTVLHKTDVGGVRLNVGSADQVRETFAGIVSSVRSKLGAEIEVWGVLVQKMLRPGKELILGVTRHPTFGPLLMVGLGGIYAEVFRDASFRLAPIRQASAVRMLKSIRAYKLLEGVRGEPPSDVDAAAECLLRLSQLVVDEPRISELDVNPLIVYPRGAGVAVADARIILS